MKKVLHIISHTHWDREWYMSFEQHRMRLVELMDSLIEKMEHDERYCYFHLDGQTIIIEDYLEICPHMRERLFALIKAGRIQVGPWYVLQDEYLTSGEANVRNMSEGLRFCKENGVEPVKSGYMPDAFGNIAQLPQILDGFNIDNAVFGRGIGQILADNTVATTGEAQGKELIWYGADGTHIMGIMFTDWYDNANELPSEDETEIKEVYGKLIESIVKTANSPHLLAMNGSDHQPIQLNLPESIENAKRIFGDKVEIKHSNFKDFIDEIRPYSGKFTEVRGELASQYTSGIRPLTDTASTNIPMKQKNHKVQNALTHISEPINAMSMLVGDSYRDDMLRYAWKKLMQCHPHDSICCCSCDAVPKEMSVRFDKAYDVAKYVALEAMDYIVSKVNTKSRYDINIAVFHTTTDTTSHIVETLIYSDDFIDVNNMSIRGKLGNIVGADIQYNGVRFTYTIPKDKFRQSRYAHCYTVRFPVKLKGIGCFVYGVSCDGGRAIDNGIKVFENGAENDALSFKINKDGTIDLTEKATGRVYKSLNLYEDTGDCGDSYLYTMTEDKKIVYPNGIAKIDLVENNAVCVSYEIIQKMNIPDGIDENKLRNNTKISHEIRTTVKLNTGINRLDIKTEFVNRSKNHRVRALFPCGIESDTVMADGQFDVIRRNINPWLGWKNPNYTQRMQAFIGVEDKDGGLIVAVRGLNEYEVLRDGKNTMAVTLLRSIGEIGDWGVFPTPDMQLVDEKLTLNYSIIPYSSNKKTSAFSLAYSFAGDFISAKQTGCHDGKITADSPIIAVDGNYIIFSAFKKANDSNEMILRIYNVSENTEEAEITFDNAFFGEIYLTNLSEYKREKLSLTEGKLKLNISSKKIVSLLLRPR